ncbi:Ubiquitin-like-specific protease ESD4 [Vitis vinifera]|uniref:Ubiquitin-like-specific protease ESD4 n=1 Tax=Vitis vinifera TaxID=29760 RepID=A0A438EPD1_VITVI|nr:Ubiquitin-like-specific protease ESD4 [Vitis vinifera]
MDVTDDEVERNDIPMDVNIDMEASRNLQLAEKHMTKELKDDYSIDDPVIDIAKLFGTPTMSGEFSVYVIPHHLSPAIFKRRREIKKSHILQHPFKDPTKRKKLRKEIEKPLTLFDPLRPISEEALESFQKWMSDDQGSTIDIDYMHIDKKNGFNHCLIMQNAQARWIKHGKKWNQFKLPENDILIDYANGLQPLYSVKWPDVDIVYVPINVWASHWVLGVVHLHRRIIYVYDSLMGINNNARLQVAIKPLAKLLPHILNAIAYYGFHGDTKVNYQEWEIEWLQDIPQQENDGDCGMFVIKYVEYLMHNHPLKSLTSARMDWFREKMAAKLFYMKYLPM